MNKSLRFILLVAFAIAAAYIGHRLWVSYHHASHRIASANLPQAGKEGSEDAVHTNSALPPEDPHAVFSLVSALEGSLDGSPALTLNFSLPLDTRVSYGNQIDVFLMSSPASKAETTDNPDDAAAAEDDPQQAVPASKAVSTTPADIDTKRGQRVSGAWVVGENPRILQFPVTTPGSRYVVVVHGSLRSPGGKTLKTSVSYSITTRAMNPAMYFASKGTVLPAHQNGGLPVVTINVPEVDVEYLRVKPEQLPRFLDLVIRSAKSQTAANAGAEDDGTDAEDGQSTHLKLSGAVYSWDLNSLQSLSESVYHGRFLTDARKNRRNVTFLPVESIKELAEPGIYVAVMNQPGHFDDNRQTTYFYVTDLGLSLRQFDKTADVFVSSLTDAKAVSGVDVDWLDAQGHVLATQRTDDSGHAAFASRPSAASVLMAHHDNQLAIIALHEPALDVSEYPVTGSTYRPTRVFAYSGRDLYRPGETFDVSAFMRDADGEPVSPQPLQALLRRADGRSQFVANWRPDPHIPGFYHQRIELPVDAPTGVWTLQLRADPADKTPSGEMQFHVEEFVPEKLKMDLASDQTQLQFGQDFVIDVHGAYLFCAPAANNRLLSDVALAPDHNPLADKLPGFYFGDVDAKKIDVKAPDETTLDAHGVGQVSMSLPQTDKVQTPYTLKATLSLLETGGRPLIRSIQRTIWPADALVGIHPLFGDVVNEDSQADFEVVRARQDGSLSAASGLQMRLIRENREFYWRYNSRSWESGYTENDELVDTRNINVPAGSRAQLHVGVRYGLYRLELTDPVTHLTMRYRFTAGWSWDNNQEDALPRPDRVGLMLDHASYKNGDTAKLTVSSPHHGQAIVTVEGDRVLWSERIAIDQDKQVIEIPVAQNWKRHDLYVNVLVLRPGSEGDLVTPTRALGFIPLPLARTDRKLSVSLDAADKVRPETSVPVKIKVPGAKGQAAMVTVSAVDVGILNITQFVTPDPWQYFYGQLGYGADLHDVYGRLIEKMAGQIGQLKFGGDAADHHARVKAPQKVRLVDVYNGPVQLNAQGEATVMVTLPDFNGRLRLMATVASGDRFGSGERDMTVAAPVIAELNTPRFMALGDHATLALDVHNLSGKPQNLHVMLEGDRALNVVDGSRELHLANLDKNTLQFELNAGFEPGLHNLRVRVDCDAVHIDRNFPLQIEATAPQRRFISYSKIPAGQTVALKTDEVGGLYPATLSGHLLISDHVPLDVNAAVNGLLVYPYGCVEQTTSTTYPWLYVDEDLAKRYKLKSYTLQERAERVDRSMAKLAALQARSGGFSLWGGENDVEPWISAYVASFMQDAHEQGFSVPDAMYQKSLDYLLRDLQSGTSTVLSARTVADSTYLPSHGLDTLAFEGFVLARANRAPLATLRQIFDQRSRMLTPLGKVYLGLALKFMGDSGRANIVLHDAVKTERVSYRWGWDYGSDLRDYAESYALVTRYKVNLPEADQWLMRLADALRGRQYGWYDTQEQLSILLAARGEDTVSKGAWQASLKSGNTGREINGAGAQVVELDNAEINKIRVLNRSNNNLYVTQTVTGSSKTEPVSTGNYLLERTLYQPDGELVGSRALKVGETVIVRLHVSTKRGYDSRTILVVDQVPAGLEIENLNLVKDSRLDAVKFGGVDADDAMHNPNITHVEYRDDRFAVSMRLGSLFTSAPTDLFYQARVVTPGQFVMPGTNAEDMYNAAFSDDAPSGHLLISGGGTGGKALKSEVDTPASGP